MTVYEKQLELFGDNPEYAAFVAKFRPKKTTDDCHTPENVYGAVLGWASSRYGFDPARAVRPFWPGGDYRRFDYPEGCVVVDNPPFSIFAQIIRFYMGHKVPFFLFGPALTLFTAPETGVNYVVCGATVTYANGAQVNTSFATSLGEWRIETAPDLHDLIEEADKANRREGKRKLRKYAMPDHVATAARLGWLAVHGTRFAVRARECRYIGSLDCKCELFGGGFLLSERAAAERVAAERAALSEREWAMVRELSKED